MKHRRRWILLLAFVALLLGSRDLVQRRFGTWPKVEGHPELVADCSWLLQTHAENAVLADSGINLPKDEWPSSILELNPRAVTLYPGVVDILISTGGIGAAYGYLVIPDESNTPRGRIYARTRPYKTGIYFWEATE